DELRARSISVGFAIADISDAAAVLAAVNQAASEIGAINALINNAGINVFSTPLETSEEQWNRNFDVNVKGAWNCSKAVLPSMLE
ncbi:SDR family NAD(P)-dependent oxidoreductase, partial [Mycobacterium tuberculosis]|nr:SDR family NAD(P)-dependent oxidoreductase [Mycobacterium tuberculosis]